MITWFQPTILFSFLLLLSLGTPWPPPKVPGQGCAAVFIGLKQVSLGCSPYWPPRFAIEYNKWLLSTSITTSKVDYHLSFSTLKFPQPNCPDSCAASWPWFFPVVPDEEEQVDVHTRKCHGRSSAVFEDGIIIGTHGCFVDNLDGIVMGH